MRAYILTGILFAVCACGCTRESLRTALESQRRADEVQQAVFERQHESLCVLLYRDLKHRLEDDGAALTADQRAALNDVWNERDLIEYWLTQHERAKALRLVGVDAKLYADQSAAELVYKQLKTKAERGREAIK